MTLNQMFDFTPVYIYIVAAVQLFIGFSLSFAIGQILPLRIREFMYYLFSFLFLFIPFLYEIATANVQSGMRSFLFYLALLITIFLFTKESFLKKVSTILIFFLPAALAEIAFNFLFPLLWKRYIRFIHLTTFVEMILLPVLCTNGFLIFLPELFGMTGWILLFFILFVLSLLFLHAVTQIPVILKQIRVNKEKKKRIEKQIFIYKQYQEQNILLRRQNHDMNNHLQALSFLLSQNRIDDMKKYIKELLKE